VVAVLAVAAVLLGLGAVIQNWLIWEADIGVSTWRTTVDGASVAATEEGAPVVVTAKDDRIVALELAFTSPESVEITEVAVSIPPRAPVRFFAVQSAVGPLPAQGEQPWGDFESFDPGSDDSQRLGMQMRVILSTTTAACGDFAPGVGVVIDEVDVTYQARSRTRHRTVSLPTPIEVEVPASGCR
jgi:hypothetical protein